MPVSAVSTSAAAQTLYPEVVNGYVCYSAADVQKALQFSNPHPVPTVKPKAASTPAARGGTAGPALPGYTARAAGRTSSSATRGRLVDIFA